MKRQEGRNGMTVTRRRVLVVGGIGLFAGIGVATGIGRTAALRQLLADTSVQPPVFPSCSRPWDQFALGSISAIHIPAEDRTPLAVDIVFPAEASLDHQFTTILIMTRYWRREQHQLHNNFQKLFASNGYAVVFGDVRGTGASFGTWPYHRSRAETFDFSAVIDWIVAQPWSDGRVIGFGNSYTANTADWMAERHHPALKAIVPRFPDYDPYEDLYFPGGVPNAYMGRTWGLRVKKLDQNVKIDPLGNPSPGVQPVDGPDGDRLLAEAIAARESVPSVWEGLQSVTFRDDRPATWDGASMHDWSIRSHAASVQASGTPIQSWAGWLDAGTANGAIRRFVGQSNPQRIYLGPWSHGAYHAADPLHPGDTSIHPELPTQYREDLCFIERCLGQSPPEQGDKVLYYYTIGEQRWKSTRQWPVENSTLERWYFSEAGTLSSQPGASGFDDHEVDFAIGTGPRNRWATNNDGGAVDYGDRAAIDRRLLTYTSEPLAKEAEITGHPVARLFVSSTHDDGNFFVYLETVSPDGVVTYLTEGQLRALHRKTTPGPTAYGELGPQRSFLRRDAAPLLPGEVAELAFALHPISALIPAGHRIRIAISGADCDTFARIPYDGDPVLKFHRSPEHPSRVELPVILRGDQ
jgi:hypothetical protein